MVQYKDGHTFVGVSMQTLAIELPVRALEDFCRRWKIRELAVFGSAVRDDFRPDSDVDFLVTFDEASQWSLWDVIAAEQELSDIIGRPVDLVGRRLGHPLTSGLASKSPDASCLSADHKF